MTATCFSGCIFEEQEEYDPRSKEVQVPRADGIGMIGVFEFIYKHANVCALLAGMELEERMKVVLGGQQKKSNESSVADA